MDVIRASIQLWPRLVEICYSEKSRRGLPSIRVQNRSKQVQDRASDSEANSAIKATAANRAGGSALRERATPTLWRNGAGRLMADGGTRRAGTRRNVVRERRFAKSARLVPACPISLWRDPNVRETLPQHVRMLELVFRDLSRFDVIHFHCDYIHFPLVRRLPCANVTTLHGQIHLPDVRLSSMNTRNCRWFRYRTHSGVLSPKRTGRNRLPRSAPQPPHVSAAARQLPGISGEDFARKAAGPRHRDCEKGWNAIEDRGQDLRRRSDVFSETIAPLLRRVVHLWNSSAKSGESARTSSCAALRRCCSRSTGPSRLAWS